MKTILAVLLAVTIVAPTHAADAPATDATIRELLDLTQPGKMMDSMWTQIDAMVHTQTMQALGGEPLTDAQKLVLSEMNTKMFSLFKDEMSWSAMEPAFIETYKQNFSDAEVQGMVAFYKSPAGQALLKKMPVVMQASMKIAQSRMAVLMPKLKDLQQESIARLKEVSGPQPPAKKN